jgi:seryl-tRNA synthetase
MLDPQLLRNQLDNITAQLAQRGFKVEVERLKELEVTRKQCQVETEQLQNERNRLSKTIGKAKAAGEDATSLMAEVSQLNEQLKTCETQLQTIQTQLNDILMGMPNIPHESVPIGRDESENVEIRRWQEPKSFNFTPKDHVDLGEQLGLLDFETAAKITGARFSPLARAISPLTPCLDSIHARFTYTSTWIPRSLCPLFSQCR